MGCDQFSLYADRHSRPGADLGGGNSVAVNQFIGTLGAKFCQSSLYHYADKFTNVLPIVVSAELSYKVSEPIPFCKNLAADWLLHTRILANPPLSIHTNGILLVRRRPRRTGRAAIRSVAIPRGWPWRTVVGGVATARRTAHAMGPVRTILVRRQLAVMVFIERQQLRAGVGDCVLINDAIMVCVQRFHQRRGRRPEVAVSPWRAR